MSGNTFNYLKSFVNTSYCVSIGVCSSSGDTQATECKIKIKSKTQLQWSQAYNGNNTYNKGYYNFMVTGY